MNTKQVKKAVTKNVQKGTALLKKEQAVAKKSIVSARKKGAAVVKQNIKVAKAKGAQLKGIAKVKGAELKAIAKSGYDQLKKELNITPSEAKKLELRAMKEYEKLKKQMENTSKKVESYVKKNPGKAAAISAGIGAALVGAAALLLSGKDTDKKATKRKK